VLWFKKPALFLNLMELDRRLDRLKTLFTPRDKLQRIRLYAASFAIDCAWTGFSFAVSWHAEKTYQVGYEILGYLGSAGACAYAPLTLVAGWLSDKMEPEKIFRSALVSFLACLGFLLFMDTIVGLFIAVSWVAASFAFFWAPIQNKLSTFTTESSLGPVLGVFNICWCCGVFAGPIISSWAYSASGFYGSIAASGIIITAALFILAPAFPKAVPHLKQGLPINNYGNSRYALMFLSMARFAVFAGYFAVTGITRLFPRFATHFGIDVLTAGTLISVIFAAQTLTFLILRYTSRWQYSFKTLVSLQIAAFAGLVLIPFTRNMLLIGIILCSVGALNGLVYYSSLFYALALRDRAGRRSGIHEALVGSGAAIGPLLGGWMGSMTGQPWSPFIIGAGIILAALIVEVIFFMKTTR
jgi:MFS family permease